MKNLSYWESETYFRDVDFVVVGSGIVGLSTAHFLRKNHPQAKILILERGVLPEGASTKNAGFACFGTVSELLNYSKDHSRAAIFELVRRRYEGLQTLRALLGDEAIQYREWGGHEIYRPEDALLWEHSLSELDSLNALLKPIFGTNPFYINRAVQYFSANLGMISTAFEGQIHSGQLLQALIRLVYSENIQILTGLELNDLEDSGDQVTLHLTDNFPIQCKRVFLCTNAFTTRFYPLEIEPARAQVLVTKPLSKVPFKGCYHFDEGYYFFRNTEDGRILFGGGRNLDLEGEKTSEFGLTNRIQDKLEEYLHELILPDLPREEVQVDQRWSGIMGMGPSRVPIIRRLSANVFCGVRLTGTGIAIGCLVGKELAELNQTH